MKSVRQFIFLAVAFLSAACARHESGASEANPMLVTVPSDAVAVVAWDEASEMISTVTDAGNRLRKLNLGKLSKRRAVLSYCYANALVPILAVDAGRSATDSLPEVATVIARADSLGFKHSIVHAGQHNALILSPSESLLGEVSRHVKEGGSILDARLFPEALASATGDRFVILRNSDAHRWLPSHMKGPARRERASMVRTLSEWTVLSLSGKGCYSLAFDNPDSPIYYSRILESLCGETVKLPAAVADSSDFCFSIATGGTAFRAGYEAWLDANIKMTGYRRILDQARKTYGKAPLAWEQEQDIREVAIVRKGESILLLTRHGKASKAAAEVVENPWPGYVMMLYGKIFACEDPYMCRKGVWTAYGKEEALLGWAAAEMPDNAMKCSSFFLKDGNVCCNGDKTGFMLWNSTR